MRRSAISRPCKSYFDSGKAKANGEPRSFEEFLSAPDTRQIHFIGKDIIYFHTLFWPAMLQFAGPPYKVPDNVYVHGFITVSGEKMSKSRGTGISPLRYLDIGMNPEWLRYYIAAKLNANVEDIDFNPDDFVARVNSDLVGKYVNIASRAANFITRHFDGALAYANGTEALRQQAAEIAAQVRASYEAREFGRAMREIMAVADRINQDFDGRQPWILAKDPAKRAELQDICSRTLYGFKLLSVLLAPVLPAVSERVARDLFGLDRAVPLVGCAAAADARQPLSTSHDSRRPEAARRTVRDRRYRRSVRRGRHRSRRRDFAGGGDDLHRRIQAARPAGGAHRRPPSMSRAPTSS